MGKEDRKEGENRKCLSESCGECESVCVPVLVQPDSEYMPGMNAIPLLGIVLTHHPPGVVTPCVVRDFPSQVDSANQTSLQLLRLTLWVL